MPPIVLACDQNYAMPLATTLRSLVDSNQRHWPLDITILSDGFTDALKQRVLDSLPTGSVGVRWYPVDTARYANYPLMPHHSRMTYARFQLEHVFGPEVRRVVYLDTDILVLGDLEELSKTPLGGAVLAAVPDDFVDTSIRAGIAANLVGVPQVARYFNAGILVIDLDRWRRHEVARRSIEYMARFPNSPYSDQDGLNSACDRTWAAIDKRWNFQQHLRVRIDDLADHERPAIVHFITGKKPWLPKSTSLNATMYRRFRDRTQFREQPMERMMATLTTLSYRVARKGRRVAAQFR